MKTMWGYERKEKLCCNCCRFFLAVRLLVLIYSGGYGFGGGIFVNLSSGAAVIRPSALFVGDKLLSTCCSLHINLDVTWYFVGEELLQLTM